MANTNLSLSDHWEVFIKEQRELKVETLRSALIEGEQSGSAGKLDMSDIKRKARLKAGLDD